MERDDKNNILSIKTNSSETDTILSKDFIVKYEYDKDVIDNKFSDFEELVEVEDSTQTPTETIDEVVLRGEVEVANFELEALKQNINSYYNSFINQMNFILDINNFNPAAYIDLLQLKTDINQFTSKLKGDIKQLLEDSNQLFSQSVNTEFIKKEIKQDGTDYTITINFNPFSFVPKVNKDPIVSTLDLEVSNEISEDKRR